MSSSGMDHSSARYSLRRNGLGRRRKYKVAELEEEEDRAAGKKETADLSAADLEEYKELH
jgi:hypothetical protein